MSKVEKITIIPARFVENDGDKHCIIDCLVGDDSMGNPVVQQRKFEKDILVGIENPTYLFIGLMHGPGYIQMTIRDARDYEEMFIEKWGCLVLTAD